MKKPGYKQQLYLKNVAEHAAGMHEGRISVRHGDGSGGKDADIKESDKESAGWLVILNEVRQQNDGYKGQHKDVCERSMAE